MKPKALATLAIDIGGTGIKLMVLDSKGAPLMDPVRSLTPHPATFKMVCKCIANMIQTLTIVYDRISAGFPGVVINGIIKTAPNLHPSWIGVDFQKELQIITGYPSRIANDADVQGLGDVTGKGVELVITLGTGFGSSLFLNGQLLPNVQLCHHPFLNKKTYEDLLSKKALKKNGIKKWQKHLKAAILLLKQTFNYDHLYIGGGNAEKITFSLPPDVTISSNIEGILGGFKLWDQ